LIYKLLIRTALFSLDAEDAHERVASLLEGAQYSGLARWAAKLLFGSPSRPVKVAGLEFPNRVGLAAGFDKDCRLAEILPCLGFGFIELGTLTYEPQPGNPKPRMFRAFNSGAVINRLGFNNQGVRAAARRLAALEHRPVPIGLNVGKNALTTLETAPEEYGRCLSILGPYGDYFVVNISSPNTEDLRRLHERKRLTPLIDRCLSALRLHGSKPLFVKLSPDLDDESLGEACESCLARGVGIVATNTTLSRDGVPLRFSKVEGGLSGRPLKKRSNDVLRKVKAHVGNRIPIIGVGGIFSPKDAKEKLDAGADLVQVYTGWIYEGPSLPKRIVKWLN
jgi:dihydroorotate dehydrogenase